MSAASVSVRNPQQGLAWMIWPVRVLSLVAMAIAAYLFWAHASGSPIAGCDPTSGFDCDAALSSRWARWLGVPVLWVGAACYAAIFASSWVLSSKSEGLSTAAWRVFVAGVCLAAGAGMWFLSLQLLGQSSICPYCIGIHSCGLTIATIVGIYLIRARTAERSRPSSANVSNLRSTLGPRSAMAIPMRSSAAMPSLAISYASAVVALGALIGGQILFVPKQYVVSEGELPSNVDLGSAPKEPQAETPSETALPSEPIEPQTSQADPTPDATPAESGDGKQHEARKVDADAEPSNGKSPKIEAPKVEPVSDLRREGSRVVELLKGKLKLDTYEHPVLGNPEAEHVIVEFFDYTCPHCRKMHEYVSESLPRYGDQLAIVMLPVPNDILCNKYVQQRGDNHRGACKLANLAVAASDIDLPGFVKLHDWIMEQKNVPSYASSMSRVGKFTNQAKVLQELGHGDASERVQRYIELFAKLGATEKATLPMQVIGDEIVSGAPASAKELREVWESKLGIKPGAL